MVFVGEFKKNVTRQTLRALFHFGKYLFQSTRHFGECLKIMVSHTVLVTIYCLRFDRGAVHIAVAGYIVDHYCFMFDRGVVHIQGRIQDFKLGGAHLKKLRRGGAKFLGYFM